MKAGEPFQLGSQAEKNFRGKDLGGRSFRGADLSGADFSEADIRGVNFSNALLQNANFTKTKTGLRESSATVLLIGVLFLSIMLGIGAGFVNTLLELGYHGSSFVNIIPEWLVLLALAGFAVVVLRNGITASFIVFIGAFVVADVLAFVSSATVPLAGAIAVAIMIASAVGVVTAAIVMLAVAAAIVADQKAAIGVIVAFGVAFIVVAVFSARESAIVIATTIMALSAYIGRRTLKGDRRYASLRIVAIRFTSIWGTNFRGADLTGADFTQALIKSADFRDAVLTRTRWSESAEDDELTEFVSY